MTTQVESKITNRKGNLVMLISLLEQGPDSFKKLIENNDEDLIINLVHCLKKDNIENFVGIIKLDEENGDGNVLNNLLQLEPFSLPIINAFIKSDYLDNHDFCVRVDKVRQISSTILDSLTRQKLKIRKDGSSVKNIADAEDRLDDVKKELNEHNKILSDLKEKKNKQEELRRVKEEIKKREKEIYLAEHPPLRELIAGYIENSKEKTYKLIRYCSIILFYCVIIVATLALAYLLFKGIIIGAEYLWIISCAIFDYTCNILGTIYDGIVSGVNWLLMVLYRIMVFSLYVICGLAMIVAIAIGVRAIKEKK